MRCPADRPVPPDFNPRSPRGERRVAHHSPGRQGSFQSTLPAGGATMRNSTKASTNKFQSTLPAGGATEAIDGIVYSTVDFNPRSPRGERPACSIPIPGRRLISIHAPRGGSDLVSPPFANISTGFQSTLPAGGATSPHGRGRLIRPISIHAPRGGSDPDGHGIGIDHPDFNPRSPRGERRDLLIPTGLAGDFNPRSPRGERPLETSSRIQASDNFNPRSPRGERPRRQDRSDQFRPFQSTLPAGGATEIGGGPYKEVSISIHAPRGGSDQSR